MRAPVYGEGAGEEGSQQAEPAEDGPSETPSAGTEQQPPCSEPQQLPEPSWCEERLRHQQKELLEN